MYSNSTFLTPSTSNSCLCVLNNRLPRLARYLQAVFIVTNSFRRLNKLENLKKKKSMNRCYHISSDSNDAYFVDSSYVEGGIFLALVRSLFGKRY